MHPMTLSALSWDACVCVPMAVESNSNWVGVLSLLANHLSFGSTRQKARVLNDIYA